MGRTVKLNIVAPMVAFAFAAWNLHVALTDGYWFSAASAGWCFGGGIVALIFLAKEP